MQNLRDKLLKAGLVTEKQAKEADRKGAKPQGTVKQKQQSVSEEERQRREAFALRAAELLESGAAAVVEDPGNPEHAVVPGEAAKRIYEVDKQAVRFWFGPEKPIGFELD